MEKITVNIALKKIFTIERSPFEKRLLELSDRALQWTKKIKFQGSRGHSVYDIGALMAQNIRELRLNERAAGISFNFLMGIPATIIILFSLVAFLPLHSLQQTFLDSIKMLSENQKLYKSAQHTILDLMQTKRRELISFSILATIFVSSNGVLGLIRSFDRKNPLQKERSALARRAKAILLTLIIMVFLIIAFGLFILQTNFIKGYLLQYFPHFILLQVISRVSLIGIIYVTICFLYKYGPSLNSKFHFFSPGAAIATICFVLVTYGFFYIASNFIHYNKLYGSIGTLMMIMVWMFCTGLVMLVGFEVNLSIVALDKEKEG